MSLSSDNNSAALNTLNSTIYLRLYETTTTMNTNDFAIEQLEERLEMFCITIRYLGTCYYSVWGIRIPYPCWKTTRICF